MCSRDQYSPTVGLSHAPLRIEHWSLDGGDTNWNALAAMTPAGFLHGTMIFAQAATHDSVIQFIRNIDPLLDENSVCLFNNTGVNVHNDTLHEINNAFNGRWVRNVKYCPRLAPIETGFSSLILRYVRRK